MPSRRPGIPRLGRDHTVRRLTLTLPVRPHHLGFTRRRTSRSLIIHYTYLLLPALVHLFTFSVEWDASLRRALSVIRQGNYLSPEDERGARDILTAAALTYVATSLASLLNLWRWIAFLRR